jgi:aspartyl-tRNA(Asn)/glutamyl-tRNA(Gln) amidotransferase subunit B
LNKSVITERGATEIVREMLDSGGDPEAIIKNKGLASIGSEEIETAILKVIDENESAVDDYKAGKKESLNFLVGQVMKHTRGRAEPKEVRRMLRGLIKE